MASRKTLFSIIFIVNFCLTSIGQQKYGFVSSVKVTHSMPEYKLLTDSIEALKAKDQKTLELMYSEYEKLQRGVQRESPDRNTPDAVLQEEIQKLQEMQIKIQGTESSIKDELDSLEQKEMKPIKEKYLKAVQSVARAEKYGCITDLDAGPIVFFEDVEHDITKLVMNQLGIN